MSTEELPPRESMEFDVVIVGAGPSGLSAAIRLKQLNADLTIVVVEKGSEVGAHILSGAVIDPVSLDQLVPDWREDADCPLKTQVKADKFYWMTAGTAIPLPGIAMPPLMNNHHCYIGSLGNVCRWLARKAEALGVEIYPGFAAAEVLYDDKGAVRGIATGDMGIAKDGTAQGSSYTRGMELLGKYTLFAEGARGSLTKQLIAKFSLDANSEPPKFGIGLKEVWQIDPAKHQKGLIQHSFGWPLDNSTGGGSFLYHYDDNLVAVGFVAASELPRSLSVAVRRIPALQDPSGDPHAVRRRQAAGLWRARHHRGRLSVGAAADLCRRRADRLRGGLRQRAAHQGRAQRDRQRHARRRARRMPRSAPAAPMTNWSSTRTAGAVRRSARTSTGSATSSRCGRNSAP